MHAAVLTIKSVRPKTESFSVPHSWPQNRASAFEALVFLAIEQTAVRTNLKRSGRRASGAQAFHILLIRTRGEEVCSWGGGSWGCICLEWVWSVHVEMHDCGVGVLFIGMRSMEVCVKAECARDGETVHFRSYLSWSELYLLGALRGWERVRQSRKPGLHYSMTPSHCHRWLP